MSENTSKKESIGKFFQRASLGVKLKLVTLGALALAICGGSSWMIAKIIKAQKPAISEPEAAHTAETEEVHETPAFAFTYELKNLSLALESRHSRKSAFAQFTLTLDLPDEKSKRWMELNRAKLLNAVLEVGSRFSLEDFETNDGKVKFKELLRDTFVKEFGAQAPREIAIRDWIQQ